MKKVLFVLGLAMCTTAVMAQTTKKAQVLNAGPQKVAATVKAQEPVDYKASIFSKADDDTLKTFGFASDDEVGFGPGKAVTSSNQTTIINGNSTTMLKHENNEEKSFWTRIENRDALYGSNFQTTYGGFIAWGGENADGEPYLVAETRRMMGTDNGINDDNGFMLLSYREFEAGADAIDAYIEFPSVEIPADVKLLDINFRQFYRKYYDQCYIDYKVNGQWHSIEINVQGVDVEVNEWGTSNYTATLPLDAANEANLDLRIRAAAAMTGNTQTFGYFWVLDNVRIIAPGESARWSFSNPGYLNGFYGMLPQDFAIPMTYVAYSRNRGVDELTNVKTTVNHYDALGQPSGDPIVSSQKPMPAGDPTHNYLIAINESGFMHETTGLDYDSAFYQSYPLHLAQYAVSDDELAQYGTKYRRRALPTSTPELNMFNITFSNQQGLTRSTDTMAYWVSQLKEANDEYGVIEGYRWANDNGVVTSNSEFAYQFNNGLVNPTGMNGENHQYDPGYAIYTRYNTPSVIPTDNNGDPWVFRGLELVTSTKLDAAEAGAKIQLVDIRMDWTQNHDSIAFYYVGTGLANGQNFTVPASAYQEEMTYEAIMPTGVYNSFNIMFPGQPELQPNTSYLFGYELVEGNFAVAENRNYYFKDDTSIVRFDTVESLAPFKRLFSPLLKVYDVLAYDATYGSSVSGWNIETYPMIRTIVGPRVELPTHDIALQCDNDEQMWITTGSIDNLCGTAYAATEGATATFYIIPGSIDEFGNDWDDPEADIVYGETVIDQIFIDNEPIDLEDEDVVGRVEYDMYHEGHGPASDEPWEPAVKRYYYYVSIPSVQADHTIRVTTKQGKVGINDVESRVNVAIAPNPASSQVSINVEGINGMVNCSILDMSGREVSNTTFNANSEHVVSLNGIPAGAYFVRITNERVSKVEKLIVR